MRRLAPLALLATLAGCQAAPPAPLRAEVRCEPEGGLRHRCTVRLAEGERPLDGATVVVTADMPSMPLAHHVSPAPCAAAGAPGTCVAVVDFEMPGRWMLGIRVSGPRTDYVTREVDVTAAR